MKVGLDFLSRGYPYYTATLYVYCDRCGSFDVKAYLGPRKLLLIAGCCTLEALSLLAALRLLIPVYWPILCLVGCILAFRYLWGDVNYRCRRCGQIPSTRYNTRAYPSRLDTVDVADQRTQKRYVGYWPDLYDLDEALKCPEGRACEDEMNGDSTSQLREDIKLLLLIPVVLVGFPLYLFVFAPFYLLWTGVLSKLFARKSTH